MFNLEKVLQWWKSSTKTWFEENMLFTGQIFHCVVGSCRFSTLPVDQMYNH